MKKVIIVLTSLLMMSIVGISVAASTPSSSYGNRTTNQIMADLENNSLLLDLTIGREAGQAEVIGQLAEASYYGNGTEKMDDAIFYETIAKCSEAISDHNKVLKGICNESRYNELKIKYPDARPAMPGDLVNEYGDYIGPGASYDGDQRFYNDTMVMYVVVGRQAGKAEAIGQIVEASYYGNGTGKIDYSTFAGTIAQCNMAIGDYNKLLRAHCDEPTYNDRKLKEFQVR